MSYAMAVLAGLGLGVMIAAGTYYNDSVVRQSPLIGHFLPVAVVGPLMLWALLRSMLRWKEGRDGRATHTLLLVTAAVAMAACSYPGSGFFRYFAGSQARPAELNKTRLLWQTTGVLEYLPRERGVQLLDGRVEESVHGWLRQGVEQGESVQVPWGAWSGPLWRWGGLALLLGVASLCVALIVHPQWSGAERLPYPIVRVLELTVRHGAEWKMGTVPWRVPLLLGAGATLLLHLLNGLHAWGIGLVSIPLRFDFTPLRELVPSYARADGAWALFVLSLVPSVVAFSWFVQSRVSLSVGLANPLWVLLTGTLSAWGYTLSRAADGAGTQMLQLGACLGLAATLSYSGRAHYARVAARALGVSAQRVGAASSSCVWAGRCLAVVFALGVCWLSTAGVHYSVATLFLALALLLFLVITRVNAETGILFLQVGYNPATILLGWLGFEALGPVTLLVLGVAQVALLTDPRQALMTFFVNGLKLGEQAGIRPGRLAAPLVLMAGLSFAVALWVTLTTQHARGLDSLDWVAHTAQPAAPFEAVARQVSQAQAMGTLQMAESAAGWSWLGHVADRPEPLLWLAMGMLLFLLCAAAALRLAWWPVHPVVFILWGTLPSMVFGWSFLAGWALRAAILRTGGLDLHRRLTPLMVGVIVGEVVAALGWIATGWAYHYATGLLPPRYAVFP